MAVYIIVSMMHSHEFPLLPTKFTDPLKSIHVPQVMNRWSRQTAGVQPAASSLYYAAPGHIGECLCTIDMTQ